MYITEENDNITYNPKIWEEIKFIISYETKRRMEDKWDYFFYVKEPFEIDYQDNEEKKKYIIEIISVSTKNKDELKNVPEIGAEVTAEVILTKPKFSFAKKKWELKIKEFRNVRIKKFRNKNSILNLFNLSIRERLKSLKNESENESLKYFLILFIIIVISGIRFMRLKNEVKESKN